MNQADFWRSAKDVTSALADISILAAAIAAFVKFRLLEVLERRYKGELECRHYKLPSGKTIFEAAYIVSNTGE